MPMSFSQTLLVWYDANRRSLPWRGESDPYRIWLSEIMLQQTRTETVERYYRVFLERFPNVQALAAADEAEVLKLWEGMGYYSRARNLHRAAKVVANELDGVFPSSANDLRRLPGVGPYASGAIASIAFGECVPALDGNQARVLSRVTACSRVLKTPSELMPEAMELIDPERPGDYNQALMDLGASICLPRQPRCDSCPVRSFCRAIQEGDPEDYPILPPPIVKREEARTVALVLVRGRLAVRQRPDKGLLANLWEFPNYDGDLDERQIEEALQGDGVSAPQWQRELPAAKHVFTHLIWRMQGQLLTAASIPDGWRSVDASGLRALAFPSAFRRYREIAEDLLK